MLTLTQSVLRTVSGRLDPIGQALTTLDAHVVGAGPLAQSLADAHGFLNVEVAILAEGVAALHDHIGGVGSTFGDVDHALARDAAKGGTP